MNWNEKVISLMQNKGINQKELSKLSGITESSISRYLNNIQKPRVDVLLNFAKALGVTVDILLDSEKQEEESAYNNIAMAIARNGQNLSSEDKNKLILMLLGRGQSDKI